jgi:hypothetical protein
MGGLHRSTSLDAAQTRFGQRAKPEHAPREEREGGFASDARALEKPSDGVDVSVFVRVRSVQHFLRFLPLLL